MPSIPLAMVPGHIGTKSAEQLKRDVIEVTAQQVIDNLTVQPALKGKTSEPAARDIIARGSFAEINRYFYEHELSDGLPIVPPTLGKVEAFLRHTDRAPGEVLGVMHPSQAEATVWKVAVNGVMAGCRPEYMPVLLAMVEVMCDPAYGMKHGGSTPGWEAMIIINGPIREQLGFDCGQGSLRPGNQANTSIGRFVKLLDSEHGESPTDAMLRDVPFVHTVVAWTGLVLTLVYRLRPT